MNQARTRRGLVVLVALLVGLSLVAPAAAGPVDGEATDGDTFDDGLTDSSNSNTTEDSSSSDSDSTSDSETGSGDGSTSDSGTSSTSESDGSDSSGSFGSSDSGSDDSDSSESFGSSDSGSDDSDSSDSFGSSDSDDADSESDDTDSDADELVLLDGRLESEERLLPETLSTVTPESTTEATSIDGGTAGETVLVDVDRDTTDAGTAYEVRLVELSDRDVALVELTAGGDSTVAMRGVPETVAGTRDWFSGTSSTTDATGDAARVRSSESADDTEPPVDGDTTAIDARDAAAPDDDDDGAAPPQNAIGFAVSPEEVPGGPAGAGAVVGLVGVIAAAAVRQSGALSGMAGSLGPTARTTASTVPGSEYLDRLVRTLAPFRYSRYDDSDPLEHEAREEMFAVVEESPGTYLSEIAERADIPLSTARHHIRVLEREDLVSGAKVRGKRRFYPAHTDGVELAAAMNDDSTAAVIDALARLGAASVSDLADELDKDPSTVTHHVQRLEEDDVVVRERDGRAVMNKLSSAARTMLNPEERAAEGPMAGEAMASD